MTNSNSDRLGRLQMKPRSYRCLTLAVSTALMLGVSLCGPAFGGQINQLRIATGERGATQHVEVGLNKSLIIDLPVEARDVIVSQPAIAGAIMRSKQRAIVQGAGVGETNIFFLDDQGQRIAVLEVSVTEDASSLETTLAQVIPGSRIVVQQFGDRVILSGSARSQDDVEKALAIAGQFTQSPANVANIINIEGQQQVMIKVTVAEVKRDTLKQLGINLSGSLSVGQVSLGFNSEQTGLTNGGSAGVSGPSFAIDAAINALNQRDAVHLLAEPTLTAISGAPAEFLAGGELPITVTDSNGSKTEWKPFGVELKFTPTVKSNGMISLVVDTAVSELRTDGALTKRRVATTVELPAGRTLAMAGIIQDTTRQTIAGLPGLGDIPVLGALFRSREYQRNQTELVILATPYIAAPGRAPALPTDGVEIATDADAIFLGQMEKLYGVAGGEGVAGTYNGKIGFILD